MKYFSIKETLRTSWNNVWRHFLAGVGLTLIVFVMSELSHYVDTITEHMFTAKFIAEIIFWLVNLVVGISILRIYLNLYDMHKIYFRETHHSIRLIWKYFLASIGYFLLILFGLILFVIPGIYLALKYLFVAVIIIDYNNLSITEAFSKSADITKSVKWKLLGFIIIISCINILGMLRFN